jgi:hypothetical protein
MVFVGIDPWRLGLRFGLRCFFLARHLTGIPHSGGDAKLGQDIGLEQKPDPDEQQ